MMISYDSSGKSDGKTEDYTSNSVTTADDDSMSDVEDLKNIDTLRSMVYGRVHKRPNLQREFDDVARSLHTSIPDVGVLACGPVKMIEQINNICNRSATYSWGLENASGENVYFAFTEDDWV